MKETAMEAAFKAAKVSNPKKPGRVAKQALRSLERRERVRQRIAAGRKQEGAQ